MKYKNQALNRFHENQCLHIELLDKIIDFLEGFIGVDCNNGDIHFEENGINAYVRVEFRGSEPQICINFILADYEDCSIAFFIESVMVHKPKGFPKELECFFETAKKLQEYMSKK